MDIVDEIFADMSTQLHEELLNGLYDIFVDVYETCVGRTAENSWVNRSGNLRSSIGFGIYDHGTLVREGGFQVFGDGAQGSWLGRVALRDAVKGHEDTITVCLVAGMDYASYLEDIHNRDVLTSASDSVEKMFYDLLTKLKSNEN